MKNYKVLLTVLGIMALTITSCRKGEEDPLISLRSSEARLRGEWKLTGGSGHSETSTLNITRTFCVF